MRPLLPTAPLGVKRLSARLFAKLQAMPSLLALCLQGLALVIVIVFSTLAYTPLMQWLGANEPVYFLGLVLLQGSVASALAFVAQMARWWRWIHFFFPVGVWLLSLASLPSSVYLVGFIVSLSLYWTTFKTQVPFYPSRPAVWRAVSHLLQTQPKQKQGLATIDIGSGLGDMSMYLSKMRPQDRVEGIEIAPLPWLISRIRAIVSGTNAHFQLGNYEALHFAHYDMVFAYLSPAAMPQLWQKAQAEMRAGSVLVSLEFPIPSTPPSQTILPNKTSPKLYVYRIA